MGIAHGQIEMHLFIHDAEKGEGGGKQKTWAAPSKQRIKTAQRSRGPVACPEVHGRQLKGAGAEAQSISRHHKTHPAMAGPHFRTCRSRSSRGSRPVSEKILFFTVQNCAELCRTVFLEEEQKLGSRKPKETILAIVQVDPFQQGAAARGEPGEPTGFRGRSQNRPGFDRGRCQ